MYEVVADMDSVCVCACELSVQVITVQSRPESCRETQDSCDPDKLSLRSRYYMTVHMLQTGSTANSSDAPASNDPTMKTLLQLY